MRENQRTRIQVAVIALFTVAAAVAAAQAPAVDMLGVRVGASLASIRDQARQQNWTSRRTHSPNVIRYTTDLTVLLTTCDTSANGRFLRYANVIEIVADSEAVSSFAIISASSPEMSMVRSWARSAIAQLTQRLGPADSAADLATVRTEALPIISEPPQYGDAAAARSVASWRTASERVDVRIVRMKSQGRDSQVPACRVIVSVRPR